MTKEEFLEYCNALYEDRWQSEMARALGVSRTTVIRWANGGTIPDKAVPYILEVLESRMRLLAAALEHFYEKKREGR
jgi:transcriptional regulator with XRE-family HTH domain